MEKGNYEQLAENSGSSTSNLKVPSSTNATLIILS
jgi:hypothetical protein